mmetsp:Transcript_1612/g.3097  ORF Transcript_1612/g.3097 Transcript_1612/m.3097 type:complete len:434 (-) Transcript_1612:51-1352(-)
MSRGKDPDADPTIPVSIPATVAFNDEQSTTSFVDYISPPEPPVPPPAKYKLWAIILVLVFFAEWFANEAKVTEALGRSGWLSPTAAFFFTLAIIVFVLVYATLDLVVAVFTITIKGRTFGLGPWLKQPRSEWIHCQENVVAECLSCVISILEDGFKMFDAPTTPRGAVPEEEPREFFCPSGDCSVVLKIEHRINPNKMKEYHEWMYKIDKVSARHARGLINVRKSDIIHEKSFDEETGDSNSSKDGRLHIICLTFESIDALNEWMASSKRRKLVTELKPLLAEPDIMKVQKDRVLPDAFTDLLIRQGQGIPTLQPKKWKVWWLTLLGLFFTLLWTGAVLPYYFEQWNLDEAHQQLQGFVAVFIATFLNSYVMTPLLLFLFSNWVRRGEAESETREPWRTLNDGFESLWAKALLTVALYGGFVIAWAVRASAAA